MLNFQKQLARHTKAIEIALSALLILLQLLNSNVLDIGLILKIAHRNYKI